MKQEQPNFFDSKTVFAILIVFATFWLWQSYMAKKYPQAFNKDATSAESSPVAAAPTPSAATQVVAQESPPSGQTTPALPEKEQLTRFESEKVSFNISSFGMGLKNYQLKNYRNRAGAVINYGEVGLLETQLTGRADPLVFKIEKVNPTLFVGRAKVGNMEITKTMELGAGPYAIRFKVAVAQPDDKFVGLNTVLPEEASDAPSGGFLAPVGEFEEFYLESADSADRVHFAAKSIDQSWTKVKVASVGSQYFTQALVNQSDIMPEAKAILKRPTNFAQVVLSYGSLNKGAPFDISYTAFVGPKVLDELKAADEQLGQVVDFGYFNWIGRHILELLRWFFSIFGNWGAAVIGLTICVRILVLPANLIAFRSMQAMQAIQPQLLAIKEKYKDDKQKQQLETMALMRDNKVNPIGGCLPVILQFPVFIALYQCLGHSIELYQAPFMLWIHDLSLKDPFYVLPVLMGLTMFVQGRITPVAATMDPMQAKILKFMPLVFSIFMISVPSGLTLYIFISSAFAVIQQYIFMKHAEKTNLPKNPIGVKT